MELRSLALGRWLVLLAAAALPIGCRREAPTPAPRTVQEEVRISLAERLDVADVYPSLEHVAFMTPAADPLYSGGWYARERRATDGRRWSGAKNATLEMPIVEPAGLTLRLDVTPAEYLLRKYPSPPQQTVGLLWNGEDLGAIDLESGRNRIELDIDASRQQVGLNRLELLPSYWLTPRVHRLGGDARQLSLRLEGVEVKSARPLVAPDGDPAHRDGDAIVQQAGSVISFSLPLPEGARLRGSVAPAPAGSGTPAPRGRVRVTLDDRAGRETELFDASLEALARDGSAALDVDLSRFGKDFASLDFAVSQPAGDAPPQRVRWQELRVEGTRTVTQPPPSRVPRGRYNVIVLLMDSLRADHVQPLGDEVVTPNWRRMAERGVLFENLHTQSSWTRPAVASMFTSLPPVAHGIQGVADTLDESFAYLPDILRHAGYRTVAVLNSVVVSEFKMTRGYQQVFNYFKVRRQHVTSPDFGPESEASFVWNHFVEQQFEHDKPLFLYIHEIDPHSPYEPPARFAAQYSTGQRGHFNLDYDVGGLVRNNPQFLDAGAVEYLHSLYRAEVAHMDAYLGWILDRMEKEGLTKNTLLVVVSDHGEEFYEHRSMGHAMTVYEELLRVPMIAMLPGVLPEGRRTPVAAQLMDLAPTVLDLLGIEIPKAMQGRSLLPWLEVPASAGPSRPLVAHATSRRRDAYLSGRWKLIRDNPDDPAQGGTRLHLYDLERDPHEIVDRWDQEPVLGHALRQALDLEIERQAALTGRSAAVESQPLAPEMIEALKALGYGDDD